MRPRIQFRTSPEIKTAEQGRRRIAQAGFTLIEIMAVVVIIGLLASLVGFNVRNSIMKARAKTAATQIKTMEGALELYRMDNARYPTTEQGIEALVREPSAPPTPRDYPPGGYMRGGKVPLDPWGTEYGYESPGQHNAHSFDLWSLGADGTPGGSGADADIGNWSTGAE
jgi:general secretion pathway protein G